jgi:hypothetical protein
MNVGYFFETIFYIQVFFYSIPMLKYSDSYEPAIFIYINTQFSNASTIIYTKELIFSGAAG